MRKAWCATATAFVLATSVAGPAAASTLPSPSASPTPDAAQLQAQADAQAAELAAQRAQQDAAAQAATAALEAYQTAQREAEAAKRTADEEAALLAAAEQRTTETRQRLERYVASLYRSGMGSRELALYTNLMDSSNPGQLFRGLGMVARVGGNQSDEFVELEQAERAQARASDRAAQSAAFARSTSERAEAARVKADEVVAAAVAQVARATAELATTEQALAIAQRREELVARAEVVARERSSVPFAAIEGALADRPQADCQGGELKGFPNGLLPTAALCPLWGTSGQLLRADAAAAFDAMSKAYGAQFGEPICVTDSYRSLPEQVAVRAAKPTLAAVPGSSNHGWGVAVDLCGGAERFGTEQHQWLLGNSMAYGWFLPAWAQAGGSKPEPWHWEFAL